MDDSHYLTSTYLRKGIKLIEDSWNVICPEGILIRCSGNILPACIFVEEFRAKGNSDRLEDIPSIASAVAGLERTPTSIRDATRQT